MTKIYWHCLNAGTRKIREAKNQSEVVLLPRRYLNIVEPKLATRWTDKRGHHLLHTGQGHKVILCIHMTSSGNCSILETGPVRFNKQDIYDNGMFLWLSYIVFRLLGS